MLRHTSGGSNRKTHFAGLGVLLRLGPAEDDTNVPMERSVRLFREAVRVVASADGYDTSSDSDSSLEDRVHEKTDARGRVTVRPMLRGDIRLEILKFGVHDKFMCFPATSLAVDRAFRSAALRASRWEWKFSCRLRRFD